MSGGLTVSDGVRRLRCLVWLVWLLLRLVVVCTSAQQERRDRPSYVLYIRTLLLTLRSYLSANK